MRSILSLLIVAFAVIAVTAQEETIDSPDVTVVPAVPEKRFDKVALTRTAYVHPGLLTPGASGWGELNVRVRRAAFISNTEGYELDPTTQDFGLKIDVKEQGARSNVFRQAFKAYNDAIRYLAMEAYYTAKIEEALAADPEADVTALTAKRSGIRAKLNITE